VSRRVAVASHAAAAAVAEMVARARCRRSRRSRAWLAAFVVVVAFASASRVVRGGDDDDDDDGTDYARAFAGATTITGPGVISGDLGVSESSNEIWYKYAIPNGTMSADVVIEIRRSSGIPTLSVTTEAEVARVSGGYRVSGAAKPTWGDFPRAESLNNGEYDEHGYYADYKSIKLSGARGGEYYLRVQNLHLVNMLTRATVYSARGRYELSVRSTSDGTTQAPLCAWDCSGYGTCEITGVASDNTACKCSDGTNDDGFTYMCGSACRDTCFEYSPEEAGNLRDLRVSPGKYITINYDVWNRIYEVSRRGMDVQFTWRYGGDPMVLIKAGKAPTLIDYDYRYIDLQIGVNIISVASRDMTRGQEYYIAVYNRNFGTSSDLSFNLFLSSGPRWKDMNSPTVASLAVIAFISMSFCLLLSVIKRYIHRRFVSNLRAQRVAQQLQDAHGNGRQQGMGATPADVISSIPIVEFKNADPDGLFAEGQDTCCTICLEDYAHGDQLRRFPACKHMFHQECADLWLQSSHTCPNCRACVVSDDEHGQAPSVSTDSARQSAVELTHMAQYGGSFAQMRLQQLESEPRANNPFGIPARTQRSGAEGDVGLPII